MIDNISFITWRCPFHHFAMPAHKQGVQFPGAVGRSPVQITIHSYIRSKIDGLAIGRSYEVKVFIEVHVIADLSFQGFKDTVFTLLPNRIFRCSF